MSSEILNAILLAAFFLVLFAIAEVVYHFFKVKAELTRKLVHVGTGLLTLLFPVMLKNHWLVLLLCSSFALILILSLKFNLLKSINAIDRESVGSIAYPISVYGCYLAFDYFHQQYIYFYLPILILAICDPIAALIGKRWPKGKFKVGEGYKTVMGSGMFFLSACILCLCWLSFEGLQLITYSFLIALVSCITEAVSKKGYDNITIPLSVLIGLIIINRL